MSVAALARRPAELHRRVGDGGPIDPYNNDLGVWDVIPVRVYASQRRASEHTDDGGQVSVEDWTIVFDADVAAAATDRVIIDGVGQFELTGPSHRVLWPQTGRYSHTEASARAVDAPDNLTPPPGIGA